MITLDNGPLSGSIIYRDHNGPDAYIVSIVLYAVDINAVQKRYVTHCKSKAFGNAVAAEDWLLEQLMYPSLYILKYA